MVIWLILWIYWKKKFKKKKKKKKKLKKKKKKKIKLMQNKTTCIFDGYRKFTFMINNHKN